jgi:predicted  nucleic acid-binding Zn-ribbon protein
MNPISYHNPETEKYVIKKIDKEKELDKLEEERDQIEKEYDKKIGQITTARREYDELQDKIFDLELGEGTK